MNRESLKIILFPINHLELTDYQREKIVKIIGEEKYEIDSLLEQDDFKSITVDKLIRQKNHTDNIELFLKAKQVVEAVDFSKEAIEKLISIARFLGIEPDETGYDFNIFEEGSIKEIEFLKSVRTFSLVAAAIGFIPIPISDYPILSLLQVGLISKVAKIYNFNLDAKEFLKVVLSTLGAGIIFKTVSKILCSFVPVIGWAVNASIAYAGTYSIGILAKRYIEEGGELSSEKIKAIWDKSFEDGKREFSYLKDLIFKMKDDLLKELAKYKDVYGSDFTEEQAYNSSEMNTKEDKKGTKSRKKRS